jgi:hypothetical protein
VRAAARLPRRRRRLCCRGGAATASTLHVFACSASKGLQPTPTHIPLHPPPCHTHTSSHLTPHTAHLTPQMSRSTAASQPSLPRPGLQPPPPAAWRRARCSQV